MEVRDRTVESGPQVGVPGLAAATEKHGGYPDGASRDVPGMIGRAVETPTFNLGTARGRIPRKHTGTAPPSRPVPDRNGKTEKSRDHASKHRTTEMYRQLHHPTYDLTTVRRTKTNGCWLTVTKVKTFVGQS